MAVQRGTIHRAASLIAFVSLPLGALLIARALATAEICVVLTVGWWASRVAVSLPAAGNSAPGHINAQAAQEQDAYHGEKQP